MVVPLVLAAAAVVGTGLNMLNKQQQKKVAAAINEAKVQALQDRIKFEKINAARRQRQAVGAQVVTSGARGIQYSGSPVEAVNQSILEDQFQTLFKISDYKFQQRLATLGASSDINQLSQGQIGDFISGVGKVVENTAKLGNLEKTDSQLESSPGTTGTEAAVK